MMQTLQSTQAKERPILFSGAMVRAILEGSKTQTRRVVKPQPTRTEVITAVNGEVYERIYWYQTGKPTDCLTGKGFFEGNIFNFPEYMIRQCPYGAVGDRLWVREMWKPDAVNDISGFTYKADDGFIEIENTKRAADQWLDLRKPEEQWPEMKPPKWRPSIHMPRAASRITLEITDIRVERLQDISEEDAIAEGIQKTQTGYWTGGIHPVKGTPKQMPTPIEGFMSLWDSINAKTCPWDSNCWVWVVSFCKVDR